ncbi:MAG: YidC/Oxa1 family membrane protein insertase [Treponemataceae bacterium]
MNPLYAMFIYPLELIYHFIYSLCYTITGNYGVGLIVLSCLAAIGYLPLGRLAVKAQHKEKQLSALLKPKLDKIKTEETDGSKRQLRTSNLYKKYRYHPFLAIRSAFGVILQLPFLLGAYYMISNFTALEGQNFLFISDLSKPDGLLGGVNFLPFLMTAINICTTLITPKLSIKDRTQAFIIAGGFLWLLYSAPSALLFFWTTNNLIFLVQNLITRIKLGEKESSFYQFKLVQTQGIKTILIGILFYSIYILVLTLKSFFYFQRDNFDFGYLPLIPDFIILLFSVWIITYAISKIRKNNPSLKLQLHKSLKIFLILLPALFLCIFIIKTNRLFIFRRWNFLFYSILFITNALIFLLTQDLEKLKIKLTDIFKKTSHQLFISCLLVFITIFFVYNIALLYESDSSYFSYSIFSALAKILPFLVCFLFFLIGLYVILPPLAKYCFLTIFFFVTTTSLLYFFVFKGNYGALDLILLSNPKFYIPKNILFDVLCFSIAWIIVIYSLFHKIIDKIILVFIFFFVSISFMTTYSIIKGIKKDNISQNFTSSNDINFDQYYGLSKTEPNILIFIFDMFTGGHMEQLLERNPNFWDGLDGFTWYPDTLAASQATLSSAPSMYAGYDYTHNKMLERGNIFEEANQSYTKLPESFAEKGFFVSLNNPSDFMGVEFFYKNIKNKENILLAEVNPIYSSFYQDYIQSTSFSQKLESYFLILSLFNITPHIIRYFIYDNGNWLDLVKSAVSNVTTAVNIAKFKLFQEKLIDSAKTPTLKIHYNELSHISWHLEENNLKIVKDPYPQTKGQEVRINGIVPEHLFTEEHILHMMINYIEDLKNLNIYDNTRIIIASDHCSFDSQMLLKTFWNEIPQELTTFSQSPIQGRPHALLLVKDFKELGKLKISQELMTNADTYYLARKDFFSDNNNSKEKRQHFLCDWNFKNHTQGNTYCKSYEVEGTMFTKENWKLVEEVK